jgi:hypothetical protein
MEQFVFTATLGAAVIELWRQLYLSELKSEVDEPGLSQTIGAQPVKAMRVINTR